MTHPLPPLLESDRHWGRTFSVKLVISIGFPPLPSWQPTSEFTQRCGNLVNTTVFVTECPNEANLICDTRFGWLHQWQCCTIRLCVNFFQKKRAEGKPYMTSVGHACRKMVSIIFAVLRDNKPYIRIFLTQFLLDN